MKVLSVVGARPNFMKIAPIIKAFKECRGVKHVLVHTGQHYDTKMSKLFFDELNIPKPDVNLAVRSGNRTKQINEMIGKLQKVMAKHKPDLVIVVGDVNSTLAGSLVAAKMDIPLAHVEAGLRSFDNTMPEEINRVMSDGLADILFTTCQDANKHLIREGILQRRIFFEGNVMIDALKANQKKASKSQVLRKLKLKDKDYVLVTLHRPENVDKKQTLIKVFNILGELQEKMTVVFPVHPRTQKSITRYIGQKRLKRMKNIKMIAPLGYLDFLHLMTKAKVVVTDSGGVQEETTVLKVPCLTVRNNTERPVTIKEGTNQLVGLRKKRILDAVDKIIMKKPSKSRIPKFWDGKTANRIVKVLTRLNKEGGLKL